MDEDMFCTTCGRPRADGETGRCPGCGTLSAAYPGAPYAGPARQTPQVGAVLVRVLRGNWLGALATAASILAVAATSATGLALLATPDAFGGTLTRLLATHWALGAFGVDLLLLDGSSGSRGDGALGVVPLTISVLSLGVGALVFRRACRSCPSFGAAVGDAVRAALLVALGTLLAALLLRTSLDRLGLDPAIDLAPLGEDDDNAAALYGVVLDEADHLIGPSRPEAALWPFVVVLVVLVLAVIGNRALFGPRLDWVHRWFAAPVAGLGFMLAVLPVLGLVVAIPAYVLGRQALADSGTDVEPLVLAGALAAYAANLGFLLVATGSGARLTGVVESRQDVAIFDPDAYSAAFAERLGWFVAEADSAALWWVVVVVGVWLLLGATWVARHSTAREQLAGDLLRWAVLLLLFVPWLAHLAGGSLELGASYRVQQVGATAELELDVAGGPLVAETTALLTLVALLLLPLVALPLHAVDLRWLGSRTATVASGLQTRPQTQPRPPGPPYGPT